MMSLFHVAGSVLSLALLLISPTAGFSPLSHSAAIATTRTSCRTTPLPQQFTSPAASSFSPLFHHNCRTNRDDDDDGTAMTSTAATTTISKRQKLKITWDRVSLLLRKPQFDTLQAANLQDAQTAGLFGTTVKKVHDPKTYLVLGVLAALKWDWCFKSPYFWFVFAFCVKWYRARYVYKIPVWDRQPNWNNVITSKDQEKDLKAFTCKNCGSTIFIAKTREFFFEGATGIGGLGCFSCGEKGKDNFLMDRERIVEDVADEDDYFDYERPLDFVSRAERRQLMKDAQGDEDVANQLLAERTTGMTSDDKGGEQGGTADEGDAGNEGDDNIVDVEIEEEVESVDNEETADVDDAVQEENEEVVEEVADIEPEVVEPPKKAPKKKKKKVEDDDDLDLDSL